MSLVKSLKIGSTSYDIRDVKATKALTDTDRATLLSAGTYRGETVETGAKFLNANGVYESFTDTITGSTIDTTPTQIGTLPGLTAVTTFEPAVAYGNGIILVTNKHSTNDGLMWRSDDKGTTWTSQTFNSYTVNVVFYDGFFYRCYSNNSTRYLDKSADGITWTALPTPPSTGLLALKNGIVLEGYSIGYYTTDLGQTWTQFPFSYDYYTNDMQKVTIDGRLFLGGKSGGVWLKYTDDGANWTDISSTLPSAMVGHSNMWKFNDVYYMNYLHNDYADQTWYAYSTDLTNWTDVHERVTGTLHTDAHYQQRCMTGLTFEEGDADYATSALVGSYLPNVKGMLKVDNNIVAINYTTGAVNRYALTLTHSYSLTAQTYTKAQVDTALAGKASTATFTTSTAGLVPGPTSGETGKFLKGDGTWADAGSTYTAGTGISITNNTISAPVMTGASSATAGASGIVPAPAAGAETKFLRGDGSWVPVGGGGGASYVAGDRITFDDAQWGKLKTQSATVSTSDKTLTITSNNYAGALLPDFANTNMNTISTMKFHVKCTLAGTTRSGYIMGIFGPASSGGYAPLSTYILKKGYCYITGTSVGSLNLSDSDTHYFTIERESDGTFYLKHSTDDATWTTVGSKSVTTTQSGTGAWNLGGYYTYNQSEPGIVYDLTDCYIEINGVKVWQGFDSTQAGTYMISAGSELLSNRSTADTSVIINPTTTAYSTNANNVAIGSGSSITSTASVAVGNNASATSSAVSVGYYAAASSSGVAVGSNSSAANTKGIGIGYKAKATGVGSVQIGEGTNATADTLQYKEYPVINPTGEVYADRLALIVKKFTNAPTTAVADRANFLGQLAYSTALEKLYWAKAHADTTDHYLNMSMYNTVTVSSDYVASGFYTGTSTTNYLYKDCVWPSTADHVTAYTKMTVASDTSSYAQMFMSFTQSSTRSWQITTAGYITTGISGQQISTDVRGHTVWFVYDGYSNTTDGVDLYMLIDDNNTYPSIEDLPALSSSVWTKTHSSVAHNLAGTTQIRLGSSYSYGYQYMFQGSIDLKCCRVVIDDNVFLDAAPLIHGTTWQEVGGGVDLTTITGYDATKVQTLKNMTGTIQWVEEDVSSVVDSLPAQASENTLYFVTGA